MLSQIAGFSHFYQLNSILIFSSFIHLFIETWVVSTCWCSWGKMQWWVQISLWCNTDVRFRQVPRSRLLYHFGVLFLSCFFVCVWGGVPHSFLKKNCTVGDRGVDRIKDPRRKAWINHEKVKGEWGPNIWISEKKVKEREWFQVKATLMIDLKDTTEPGDFQFRK